MPKEFKYSLTFKGIHRYTPPPDSPEAEIMEYMKEVDVSLSATEITEDLGYEPKYLDLVTRTLDGLNREGALLKTY